MELQEKLLSGKITEDQYYDMMDMQDRREQGILPPDFGGIKEDIKDIINRLIYE